MRKSEFYNSENQIIYTSIINKLNPINFKKMNTYYHKKMFSLFEQNKYTSVMLHYHN